MAGKNKTFGWLQVDEIAEALADAQPTVDPLGLRFPQLRETVQKLPRFAEEPGHPVNEKILETIQMMWLEEKQDRAEDEDE